MTKVVAFKVSGLSGSIFNKLGTLKKSGIPFGSLLECQAKLDKEPGKPTYLIVEPSPMDPKILIVFKYDYPNGGSASQLTRLNSNDELMELLKRSEKL